MNEKEIRGKVGVGVGLTEGQVGANLGVWGSRP